MTLQRLVLTFKPEEIIVHALYRSKGETNPGTVRRRREVTDLVREGLRRLGAVPYPIFGRKLQIRNRTNRRTQDGRKPLY